MKPHGLSASLWILALLASVFVTACGDGNGGSPATMVAATVTPTPVPTATRPAATNTPSPLRTPTIAPTQTRTSTATPIPTSTATIATTPTSTAPATPTATASPTSSSAGVTGLLVLDRAVTASTSDALDAPPEQWQASPDGATFDRSLAAANWSIDGDPNLQGTTGRDGRFTAAPLPAGPHTLQISKTLDGNLAAVSVPFIVGDDGSVDLVVQLSWGQARSSFTYSDDGVAVGVTQAANGAWLRLQDGRIRAFGDAGRTFADADDDGQFDPTDCAASSRPPLPTPYPCNADGTCAESETRCTCVPSCPACDECLKRICVPSCPPVEIRALTLSGPAQLVVGQSGAIAATATLSDGTAVNVTGLVAWQVSDPAVAAVDSWGTVSALRIGKTSITATFGTIASPPLALEVTARPALRKILLQNVSCVFPLGDPLAMGGSIPASAEPGQRTDLLPVPNCTQVVQIGGTIRFRAIGEFDAGYYQDITEEVQWKLTPPEVGNVVSGLFTAEQAGTATLTASLGGVASDPTTIRVVTEPTVVALSIYADNGGVPLLQGTPAPVASGMPCSSVGAQPAQIAMPCCCPGPLAGDAAAPCRCTYMMTVLRGDRLQFHATAQYDTGVWQDVTKQVTWRSSDAAVAAIDASGAMTAVQAGDASIDAIFDAVTSDPAGVHVVNQATLQSLYIYQEGNDRVVAKGDQRFFHANGSYDIGIARDVTTAAVWRSGDDAVGGFDAAGVFTGRAAGTVQVWAEVGGVTSNMLSLQVYETSELAYCDPDQINRAVWADDFNRVTLESDCAFYRQPGIATLRYTVTEIQPHGGIFNPCLDLYVFAGKSKVRTIREQGCGEPFLPSAAAGRDQEVLKYQLRAFWDLKDDAGSSVAPGSYTIYGRFYLYYDPVVSIDVRVLAPNEPTPTPRKTATPGGEPTPAALTP